MRTYSCFLVLFALTIGPALAQKDVKATIMAANQKFVTAFEQGATTMNTLYTANAELLPPNSEPVKGSATIGTFWQGAFNSGVKHAKLETTEAEQHGDMVMEVGQYTLTGADNSQLDAGKYIVIWKKEMGVWKLHRDIWNTNSPASVAVK